MNTTTAANPVTEKQYKALAQDVEWGFQAAAEKYARDAKRCCSGKRVCSQACFDSADAALKATNANLQSQLDRLNARRLGGA